ncbi:MAG: DUF1573 domain-containing protein [Isosphaeraceae bacterium]
MILSVAVVAWPRRRPWWRSRYGRQSELEPARRQIQERPLPKVEIDGSLTHEFGNMVTQKTGSRKWVVHNRGEGDLELWLSGSSCVCTVAKLEGRGEQGGRQAGRSTEIEVEWKTKDMVGEFSKNATISTNDPRRPEFKLTVRGMVQNPVVIMPPPVENTIPLGSINNDEPMRMSMAVFSPDRPEMKVTKITSSKPDAITVTPLPLTKDEQAQLQNKGGYRVNLEIKPGMSQGNLREELIIETDHPDQPKLQYILTGTITGPISVIPPSLNMVTVNGKRGGKNELTLLVREGRSTNFTIAHKPEKVEVSLNANETPTLKGRYRLTISVPPGSPAFQLDDQIILKTDHPRVSELRIPVSIVVGSG